MADAEPAFTDAQREVACYLWLSPYHPETWPLETINRLVALRREDERRFLIAVRDMMHRPPTQNARSRDRAGYTQARLAQSNTRPSENFTRATPLTKNVPE